MRKGFRAYQIQRYFIYVYLIRYYSILKYYEMLISVNEGKEDSGKWLVVSGSGEGMNRNESGTMVPYYYHTNSTGNVTAITDSTGNLVERVDYDIYGMPTFTDYKTDPQNPTMVSNSLIGNSYLFHGRRYDPESNKISHQYDNLNRKIKTIKHLSTGEEIETSFTYYNNDLLKSITDSHGNTTSYEYDEQNRLTKITYPDKTERSFTYSLSSNIIKEKDRNGIVINGNRNFPNQVLRTRRYPLPFSFGSYVSFPVEWYSDGINIHHSFSNDGTGFYDSGGRRHYASTGCLLIRYSKWDEFYKLLNINKSEYGIHGNKTVIIKVDTDENK